MVHNFAYLANHLLFLLHCLCNDLYLLQGLRNTNNHSFLCSGWSDTAYGCSKSKVHAVAAEAGGPNWQVLSSTALKSYVAVTPNRWKRRIV